MECQRRLIRNSGERLAYIGKLLFSPCEVVDNALIRSILTV